MFWCTLRKVDAAAEAGPAAELLWTSALKFEGLPPAHCRELCSLLNAALRGDDALLMPVTAGLTHAINDALCVGGPRVGLARAQFPRGDAEHPPGTTFRGGGFDDRHRGFFVAGRKYRVPGFLATSFDRRTAERFRDNIGWRPPGGVTNVLWVVHVDPAGEHDPAKRCKHVNYVQSTHVGGEAEYLFSAYSVFTVVSVRWGADKRHHVELRASPDNALEDDALPSAPWY